MQQCRNLARCKPPNMLARSGHHALKDVNTTALPLQLPFLYCTNTIRQPTLPQRTSAIPRRCKSTHENRTPRSPERVPDIPFERPPPRRDAYSELEVEGSTITPNERKAFEGLFNLVKYGSTPASSNTRSRQGKEKSKVARPLRRGRSEAQDVRDVGDDDIVGKDVGLVVDADGRRSLAMPIALRAIEKETREKFTEEGMDTNNKPDSRTNPTETSPKAKAQPGLLSSPAAQREIHNFSRAISSARTDVEVWQILNERIINQIKQNPTPPPNQKQKQKRKQIAESRKESSPNPELLKATLPYHLTQTFTHLKTHFPSSPLPLSILPTFQNIAHSLSTKLANLHAQHLWQNYSSTALPSIITTLQDLESSETCGFDGETLELVQKILSYASGALGGRFGESERILWEMEGTRSALGELVELKGSVVRAVEEEAMRRAWEREAGREEGDAAARVGEVLDFGGGER